MISRLRDTHVAAEVAILGARLATSTARATSATSADRLNSEVFIYQERVTALQLLVNPLRQAAGTQARD